MQSPLLRMLATKSKESDFCSVKEGQAGVTRAKMWRVDLEVTMAALFVEQLTVIDCSLLDREFGLVGESFIVDIELQGPLDAQGMVLDFSAVKRQLKRTVDDLCDHRLLLPLRCPGLFLSEQEEQLRVRFHDGGGQVWEHESPSLAVVGINLDRINCESLASWLTPHLQMTLPAELEVKVILRFESIDGAQYRYSHGLQMHDGACQRIAHGHRSRLQIYVDDKRRPELEQQWATRFRDIYLATHKHFVRELDNEFGKRVELKYRAQEGDYRLILPRSRCYWLDTETTVEQIAAHLAQQMKFLQGGAIRVRAYEGVHKGAVALA